MLRSSYFGNSIQEYVWEARIVNNTLILAGEFPNFSGPVYGPAGIWRVDLNTNTIVKINLPILYSVQLTAHIDTTEMYFLGII